MVKKQNNAPMEINIIRLYDAPVKAVWEAWVDPKKVAKWWGPRGFTLTSHHKDVRAGGTWDYTMHGPDGTDYPNVTRYLEVEKYSRLVYDHGGTHDKPPMFRVTVLFTESKGKTKMDMTMAMATPEMAEHARKVIKEANGNSTWDRLAEFLDYESTGKEEFIINRTFEAPLATLHEMWTNPKHFSQWLAPTGFTMKFLRADIKPGKSTFFMMTNGKDVTMYGRAEYKQIEQNRIQYTQQFCDDKENVTRHYAVPTWPETMLTTVQLTEETPERTRVTVKWETYGHVTAEELATFVKMKAGMTMGWTGSFDKLEAYLEKN
jgi:uncharacterized protein YndB with AHSA1/START domain